MDSRKIFAVLIFLLLIGAGAYAATTVLKPKTTAPPVPPVSDEPNPNNEFSEQPTGDVGKKAYSKFGNATMYTLNFNSVKTPAKDELIGTITGSKILEGSDDDIFYVIDSQYLVSQALVRVE